MNEGRKHGTVSCYVGGCRCEPCKQAKRAYDREWRKTHKYVRGYGYIEREAAR